jgi:hypothetical protein
MKRYNGEFCENLEHGATVHGPMESGHITLQHIHVVNNKNAQLSFGGQS